MDTSEGIPPKENKKYRSTPVILSVTFFISVILMVVFYNYYYESQEGIEQPIPFSHRVHVSNKKISCIMCHEGEFKVNRAGIPPLQTCMLCHEKIIITFPPIKNLREHYFSGIPVEWERVINLPDFVYFSHSIHTTRGIDCSKCHGNVAGMDRVKEVKNIDMGFCIGCHREENATTDCFTCHD